MRLSDRANGDAWSVEDEALLDRFQHGAFRYFLENADRATGLVPDSTRDGDPASIATVGFALSCYPIAVERGWMTRNEAVALTLAAFRFFARSEQSEAPDATGCHGFYFHFLDMRSGRRAWNCEVSLIDTTLLLAGMLTAAAYFRSDASDEREIRDLADALYRRADWLWACGGWETARQGWTPEGGFLHYGWEGYNEASLLYVLGLGSPTHPLPPSGFAAWTRTYQWENLYDLDYLYAGPLFIHHFSHAWMDFRGIRDAFMREKDSDYFENSRRAAFVQREYARRNPHDFVGYGDDAWAISASQGFGFTTRIINGRERKLLGYSARGVPYGPDDGTLCPSAALSSLPFAPDLALSSIKHFIARYPEATRDGRLPSGFNPTLPGPSAAGWVAEGYLGLDQGIVTMMIENARTRLIWSLDARDALRPRGSDGRRLRGRMAVIANVKPPPVVEPSHYDAPTDGLPGDPFDDERFANLHPRDWPKPDLSEPYDLVVIGGGAAGRAAALRGSELGARVLLVERNILAGTRLNFGDAPSKALARTSRYYADLRDAARLGALSPASVAPDFAAAMERTRALRARLSRPVSAARLRDAGVSTLFGDARFVSRERLTVDGRPLRFRKAIVASGSRPLTPAIPGLKEAGYLTNESVFNLTRSPGRLLVIGGGPLGCEAAQVMQRLGVAVTLAQHDPMFLMGEERDAAQILSAALERDGVVTRLNTDVVEVTQAGDTKIASLLSAGNVAKAVVDEILVAVGRAPAVEGLGLEAAGVAYDNVSGIRVDDRLRTTHPKVFACGDVGVARRFTPVAQASGRLAAENAFLRTRRRLSAFDLPRCTFTDPEVAHVGLLASEAMERGLSARTFTVLMQDVDRAVADSEDDGFVKVLTEQHSDRILGATLVARHAGEMIFGISVAMRAGIGLASLADVVHAYPTQIEAIRMAGLACRRAMEATHLGAKGSHAPNGFV